MPEERTLADNRVWDKFEAWLKENVNPTVDVSDLPLNEIRADYTDLTISEARDQAAKDERIGPFLMGGPEYEQENPMLKQFLEEVETVRRAGFTDRDIINLLRRVGLDLERPTSKGLAAARKQIKKLSEYVSRLEKQVVQPAALEEEVKKLKEELEVLRAQPVSVDPREALIRELNIWVRNRAIGEGYTESDVMFLTSFIDPERSIQENKRRIEDQIFAIKETRPRLPEELRPRPMRRPLTDRELEERIMSMPEEWLYEPKVKMVPDVPPGYEIIADGGPMPPPPPYPRSMGKYWDREIAEDNLEILEKKGWNVRIKMTNG